MWSGIQQLLRASSGSSAAAAVSTTYSERTVRGEDMVDVDGDKPAAMSRRAGIPVEIQWLIEFLIEHALDTVRVACLSVVHRIRAYSGRSRIAVRAVRFLAQKSDDLCLVVTL